MTAFEQSTMHLTPPQVDGLLRDVVTTHLSKLERLSAAGETLPASSTLRNRSATTAAPHGPIACFTPEDRLLSSDRPMKNKWRLTD